MPVARVVPWFFLLAAATLGCRAQIGDGCQRSTDCSIQGDRTCDLSHRVNASGIETPNGQGECIVEGCGADSCPGEAACVKVYGSDFLTVACNPSREDRAVEGEGEGCTGGVCGPLDDCDPREVCLPEGLCADEITARTSCRLRCGNSGDCRDGYECIRTGSRGIYAAPDLDRPGDVDNFKICAPVSQ